MLHTFIHTDRHTDRASDEAGPIRGAFAPKKRVIELRATKNVIKDKMTRKVYLGILL